jgi:uncharacterized protein YciI
MNYFVYKLIPPRPTFDADMNDEEAATMGRHAEYWQALLADGHVVVYGPVSEPSGTWGLAVFEAEDEEKARAIGAGDPAVQSGMCTFDVFPMAAAIVRS